MLEIRITIEAMEISAALNNIAAAISGKNAPITPQINTQNSSPLPAPAAPAQAAVPTSPAPGVPLSQPPKYTTDQIMAAGAALVDAGKTQELISLLNSFGVQAVTALKPEQLGAFATAMRELGAKI